jgi:hypothetical protein
MPQDFRGVVAFGCAWTLSVRWRARSLRCGPGQPILESSRWNALAGQALLLKQEMDSFLAEVRAV